LLRYFVLSVFLLAIGCSNEKEAEPYPVERDQLIHSLFLNIDQNNVSAINKDLTRLKYIIKHDVFLENLAKKSKVNTYLIKADQAIRLGDLNTAALFITQSGNGTLLGQIESLKLIKSYLQEKPFRQSKDYFKALDTIADLPLPKDEFSIYHQFLSRERQQAERLKQEEYEAALAKMVDLFSKMIISSSKYIDLIKNVILDEKFTAVDVNAIIRDIKEFSPDLELISLTDFVAELNRIKLPYADSLQRINELFVKGKDETALSELMGFVNKQRRVSQKVQIYLISRSKKLRFFLDDQIFNLNIVMDKYYKQKDLEEKSSKDEVESSDTEHNKERETTNEF